MSIEMSLDRAKEVAEKCGTLEHYSPLKNAREVLLKEVNKLEDENRDLLEAMPITENPFLNMNECPF